MNYLTRTYVGIDPGTTGAIAFLTGNKLDMYNLPVKEIKGKSGYQKKFLDLEGLDNIFTSYGIDMAVCIEDVSAMPKQGASSTGILMRIKGQLEGLAYAVAGDYTLVRPAKWKKDLKLSSDKQSSKKFIQERFTTGRCNHNQTDAACIAYWLRLQEVKSE